MSDGMMQSGRSAYVGSVGVGRFVDKTFRRQTFRRQTFWFWLVFTPLGMPDERVMLFLLILLSFLVVKLPDKYAQECLF